MKAKLGALLQRKSVRLALAAALTYASTVAATGQFDPLVLISQVAGAFMRAAQDSGVTDIGGAP